MTDEPNIERDELDAQDAKLLPDREAMSVIRDGIVIVDPGPEDIPLEPPVGT